MQVAAEGEDGRAAGWVQGTSCSSFPSGRKACHSPDSFGPEQGLWKRQTLQRQRSQSGNAPSTAVNPSLVPSQAPLSREINSLHVQDRAGISQIISAGLKTGLEGLRRVVTPRFIHRRSHKTPPHICVRAEIGSIINTGSLLHSTLPFPGLYSPLIFP